MNRIKDYVEELNTIDEHVKIEAKQCTDRIDKSVLESVCSFSNEPGLNGVVILIGLQESHDASCPYKVIGVTESEDDLNWFSSVGMDDLSDGQKTVLIFLREVGAIDNITYRQLTGLSSRAASRELKQLEQSGAILMNGLGRNTCYIPSNKLTALYSPNDGTSRPNGGTSNCADEIPEALKDRIKQMGLRVPKEVLSDIIIELCRVKPFSGEELAVMLGRTEYHIKNKIVPTLIENERLKFTYPEMINHPNQKYTAK